MLKHILKRYWKWFLFLFIVIIFISFFIYKLSKSNKFKNPKENKKSNIQLENKNTESAKIKSKDEKTLNINQKQSLSKDKILMIPKKSELILISKDPINKKQYSLKTEEKNVINNDQIVIKKPELNKNENLSEEELNNFLIINKFPIFINYREKNKIDLKYFGQQLDFIKVYYPKSVETYNFVFNYEKQKLELISLKKEYSDKTYEKYKYYETLDDGYNHQLIEKKINTDEIITFIYDENNRFFKTIFPSNYNVKYDIYDRFDQFGNKIILRVFNEPKNKLEIYNDKAELIEIQYIDGSYEKYDPNIFAKLIFGYDSQKKESYLYNSQGLRILYDNDVSKFPKTKFNFQI